MSNAFTRHYWLLLVALAVGVVAACSDTTTPGNGDGSAPASDAQVADALTKG